MWKKNKRRCSRHCVHFDPLSSHKMQTHNKQRVVVSIAVRGRVFIEFKIPKATPKIDSRTRDRPYDRPNVTEQTNKMRIFENACTSVCDCVINFLHYVPCVHERWMDFTCFLLIYIFHIFVNVNTPCTHSDFFMHALVASHRKAYFPKYEIEIEIYEKNTHTHSFARSHSDRHNKNDNHLVDARRDKKIINIWVWALVNMSAARTENGLHKHQILLVRIWCCGLNVMCLVAAPAGSPLKNRYTLGAGICQKWEDRVVCHSVRQYPMGTAPPTSTGEWQSLSSIRQLVRASRI